MLARTVATVASNGLHARCCTALGSIAIGGGRHLYLECHGSGSPTVVFDAGHRARGDYWNVSDPASPKATPGARRRAAIHPRAETHCAAGEAMTPAAQITEPASIRPLVRSTPRSSHSSTGLEVITSTPIAASVSHA
jgi:hypothetical protein